MMRNTIMTEKIVRRGVRVPLEYSVDFLQRMLVGQVYNRDVVTLKAEDTLERVQQWIQQGGPDTRHHGYPIVDTKGAVIGVLTVRDLLNPRTPPETPIGQLVDRPRWPWKKITRCARPPKIGSASCRERVCQ